jgi:23S rRNA (adenine2503-C2)-methyltransferase
MVRIAETHRGRSNRKYAIELDDGARVEAVLYREDSLCVSSQVGCAVGCPFCASGANGLGRNLSADELRAQVASVRATGASVKRVTVSGIGEPLHNHRAVAEFVRESHAAGTPVSLTTSGGPLRRLEEWFELPHRGLTISVHAGTEATRVRTVPRGPALDPLFETLERCLRRASNRRRRRLALAYLLLAGMNDDDDEVEAFVTRAEPLGAMIHLYSYNPVPTSSSRRASAERYQTVYHRLRDRGLDVRRSSQARIEATGGCGTLVALRANAPRAT